MDTKWVLKQRDVQTRPDAVLRLFAFPQAGSGAYVFNEWRSSLPSSVEVLPIEYPGRNTRRTEPPITGMQELVESLADALLPLLQEKPFALFGHSLGSWVAYALVQELQRRGGPLPVKLYASGNRSPLLAGTINDVSAVTMHQLPYSAFWQEFERRYGPNPNLKGADVRQLVYPMMKADFQLGETYRPADSTLRLPCPLVSLGGEEDNRYRKEQMAAWEACAAPGHFQEQWFSGGHFYLFKEEEAQAAFLAWLASDLQQLAEAVVTGSAAQTLDAIAAELAALPEAFATSVAEGQAGEIAAAEAREPEADAQPPEQATMLRGGSSSGGRAAAHGEADRDERPLTWKQWILSFC